MINSLQSTPGLDPGVRMQLQEVMDVWDRVQELSDLRAVKLAESQQLVNRVLIGQVQQRNIDSLSICRHSFALRINSTKINIHLADCMST